ncbi:MAG: glycosyltransferase family 4 protein [Deltaproteobacteria bacterium]|nr:glycosyltransferase family 4 protein [Deltaproteobacteria bacterium]
MAGIAIKPKLLFLITEDWYFWSHRLPVARAARAQGFDVVIATHVRDHGELIRREGFKLIPIRLRRKSKNPLQELLSLMELIRIYRRERPHIVHHVAMKPVLYGSISARLAGIPSIVNALAGLGYVFLSTERLAVLLCSLIKPLLRIMLDIPGGILILQNPDDCALFVEKGLSKKDQIIMIRGSGVDTEQFTSRPEREGIPVVMLASRMLWDKGVGEFVHAAKDLRARDIRARFVLVGRTDTDNPASIPVPILKEWRDSGVIEWWGNREDMPEVLSQAHIVVLPSYREGLPKVLLEAAACGRPLVATDVPGCREIVRNGDNGFLVPLRDAGALADSLLRLIADRDLRKRMGARGRQLVLENFSEEMVVSATMAVYRQSLSHS